MKAIIERYIADNGDIFERIAEVEEAPAEIPEIRCIAKHHTDGIEHLSYYREDDDEFICTAGVHVWRKANPEFPLDQFVYVVRKSEATQNDNVARTLYDEA